MSVWPLADENVGMVSNNKGVVSILNKYFSAAFTQQLLTDITDTGQIHDREQILEEMDVSVKEIL